MPVSVFGNPDAAKNRRIDRIAVTCVQAKASAECSNVVDIATSIITSS